MHPEPTDDAARAPTLAQSPRLVAVDLDGTLLTPAGTLSAANREAVAQTTAAGVSVVIATARPPRAVRSLHEALGLDTPLIAYNGAMVVEPGPGRVISHEPLAAAVGRSVIAWARRVMPEVVISLEVADRWYTDRVDDRFVVESAKGAQPDAVGPLDRWADCELTKLLLLGEPDPLRELAGGLLARFGDSISVHRSDAICLQVVRPGVSKGSALLGLARRLGVTREAIMAVGDAPNDLPMLAQARLPVAMGNAWEEVKAYALNHGGAVVADNTEGADGVAESLGRFCIPGRQRQQSRA